eukprot:gene16659-biopygen13157
MQKVQWNERACGYTFRDGGQEAPTPDQVGVEQEKPHACHRGKANAADAREDIPGKP